MQLILQYRIILDEVENAGFIAQCAELPRVCASGPTVNQTVDAIRRELAGQPPQSLPLPLRDSEGPLGAWLSDLELIDKLRPSAHATIERPSERTLRRMAIWTAQRYRLVLEEFEGFTAVCKEIPGPIGRGHTPSQAVSQLREQVADVVFRFLWANQLPPEALQDMERSRNAA
jgi:predicted RNase H-like HicB family nuclease